MHSFAHIGKTSEFPEANLLRDTSELPASPGCAKMLEFPVSVKSRLGSCVQNDRDIGG